MALTLKQSREYREYDQEHNPQVSSGENCYSTASTENRQAEKRENKKPQRKGCLWTVIKWCLALCIVGAVLSRCGTDETTRTENGTHVTNQTVSTASVETQVRLFGENGKLYDACIEVAKENIDNLISQEPVDTEALEEEYAVLLTLRTSEYMFKTMAHGHFSGEYDTAAFDYIMEDAKEIRDEVAKYMDSDFPSDDYVYIIAQIYRMYDDANFNYDFYLVGTRESPDIDAMWDAYFESELQVVGD